MSPSTRHTRRSVLALCGGALTSLAGCSALATEDDDLTTYGSLDCGPESAVWPCYGADPARTGVAPTDDLPEPSSPTRLGPSGHVVGPSIAGDTAYVCQSDATVAIDLESGRERWRTEGVGWVVPPTLGCGAVFVTELNRTYALDRETGDVVWERLDGNGATDPTDGPVYVDGTLYQPQGTAVAYDGTDGTERWQVRESPYVDSFLAVDDRVYVSGSVSGDDGGVVDDGGVTAVTRDGAVWWEVLDFDQIYSPPAVADGRVFAVTYTGVAFALDATDGSELWRDVVYSANVVAPPAVAEGRVFVSGGRAGLVRTLDAASGERLWTRHLGPSDVAPTVVGDSVLVGGRRGSLHALDVATGETVWRLDDGSHGRPVAVDGRVFLPTRDGLYVLG